MTVYLALEMTVYKIIFCKKKKKKLHLKIDIFYYRKTGIFLHQIKT